MAQPISARIGSAPRSLRGWLASTWQRLQSSLWFLPGWIALAGALLAVLMIDLSSVLGEQIIERFPRVFGAAAEGSRSMLATIAGSIITVAGVTFSIMVVAVSQATTQFTPRVLRNFMRDRHSQVALGTLTGVFVYCLVVIRTIRSDGADDFVPSLAVFGAFVLALVGVGMLMYFIHHIASALDPGHVLQGVHRETVAAIERLLPGLQAVETGSERQGEREAEEDRQWYPVAARCCGYVQHIDEQGLLELACTRGRVLRIERAAGDFAVTQMPLVSVAPAPADAGELEREVNRLYSFGSYRTIQQDVRFGVRQMVDIALKALSPGINDPTTAESCIDYLAATLVEIARRPAPQRTRLADGDLRLILRPPTFEDFLALTCDEIRESGAGSTRIAVRLLAALADIAAASTNRARREVVAKHVRWVEAGAEQIALAPDRARVFAAAERARAAIRGEHARAQSPPPVTPRAAS